MPTETIRNILQAKVYDVAEQTPTEKARGLSQRLVNQVFLKREDMQPVFSFKIRGAYNKLANLSSAQLAKGVITVSAGNHAQGVALAAAELGVRAVVFMPRTTPDIKVNSVISRGAEVVLEGDTFDEARAAMSKMMEAEALTYVSPYDDRDVIAGQGTVAMEVLRQLSEKPDAVFIPVGGGGLIAGMAAYIKYLQPEVKVIGVEADDSACMSEALKAGKRVILPEVGIFADGVAVKQVGELPFEIAKQCVDDMVQVNTDEICAAVKDVFEETRTLAEPAGALAIAGMKKYVQAHNIKDQRLVAVVSGANTNFDRLRHITERTALGEGQEALLAVTIPEVKGSFFDFCALMGSRSFIELNYRYAPDSDARVFVGVKLKQRAQEIKPLIHQLQSKGFDVEDLSENELAKLHIRHMIGGRCPGVTNERLLRFEFPERPGALLSFLNQLGTRWNVTLFHYRNHGAAYGRVLTAFQVPPEEIAEMESAIANLGYRHWDETNNPCYSIFLR